MNCDLPDSYLGVFLMRFNKIKRKVGNMRISHITTALAAAFTLMTMTNAMAQSGWWEDFRDTSWPVNSVGWTGDWATTTNFTIGSAAQLATFAWWVNQGTNFNGKTIVVTANLTMSARYWRPAGYWISSRDNSSFRGTFDGQNYTITGIIVDDTSIFGNFECAGLFWDIGIGGTVKNVRL